MSSLDTGFQFNRPIMIIWKKKIGLLKEYSKQGNHNLLKCLKFYLLGEESAQYRTVKIHLHLDARIDENESRKVCISLYNTIFLSSSVNFPKFSIMQWQNLWFKWLLTGWTRVSERIMFECLDEASKALLNVYHSPVDLTCRWVRLRVETSLGLLYIRPGTSPVLLLKCHQTLNTLIYSSSVTRQCLGTKKSFFRQTLLAIFNNIVFTIEYEYLSFIRKRSYFRKMLVKPIYYSPSWVR